MIELILGIDHVGLATDGSAEVGNFMATLGMHKIAEGIANSYGVACEFWGYQDDPAGTKIEIVSPVTDDSPVSGHLARSGPGLYHIALAVDDIEKERARLRQSGFVAVDPQPCAGARPGMLVAFMYLRRPAGLLVELVQYDQDHPLQ